MSTLRNSVPRITPDFAHVIPTNPENPRQTTRSRWPAWSMSTLRNSIKPVDCSRAPDGGAEFYGATQYRDGGTRYPGHPSSLGAAATRWPGPSLFPDLAGACSDSPRGALLARAAAASPQPSAREKWPLGEACTLRDRRS
jgi:hypothetical protein